MAINVNKAVDKSYEDKSLKELADAPVAALEGITDDDKAFFEKKRIRTIGDLGRWKIARAARAIVDAADFES